MRKVRWGVLSTAKIGTEKVIPAMQRGECSEVVAISSRDLGRAQQWAAKLGIARAHGSYEALLADHEVDAVYNPLPNDLHVSWSIKALEAGKHVLCEKPIGLTAAEGRELVEAGRRHPQLKLMEAFMYRHHPQWQQARELVRTGIGTLRTIHSFFSYFNDDASNIRNIAAQGGGGLMDIGCYNISLSRFLFDAEPQRVVGLVEYDPVNRCDRLASGIMEFGAGTATFSCSTQLVPFQRIHAYGTNGYIEIEIPFNAPPDRPCVMWHGRSGVPPDRIELPTCDQYTIQGDLMSRAILDDTPVPTPIEDAVRNMEVIEAIKLSGREGRWVEMSEVRQPV